LEEATEKVAGLWIKIFKREKQIKNLRPRTRTGKASRKYI
jgi:hypothetical protein